MNKGNSVKSEIMDMANIDQSLCWFVNVKFKEYLRSIQALKTEFSKGIQNKFTLS